MRWRRPREPRAPRVGAGVLLKAALGAAVIFLSSGGAVAAAIYFQVHKYIPPVEAPGAPPPIDLATELPEVKPGGPRTFLVLGSDRRAGDKTLGNVPRSDTILLIRLDPKRKRVAVLSIPRDLSVQIPGYGEKKINMAYEFGGPQLTLETVQEMFRVATGAELTVNNVIDVNFNGFQRAVNYVGGVYVDVDRRYYNPEGTGYAAIDIQPGYQRLVGSEALAYVRYRHTDSDLFRAARQQDFLRQAANQPDVRRLATISQAGDLFAELRRYFRFDRNFLSFRSIAGMLKTGLYLSTHHAPVNQIRFEPVQETGDPTQDTRLFVSPITLQRLYRRFLTGAGTRNPRRSTKTRRVRKAAAPSGLENARRLGEDLAAAADRRLHFPFYFPGERAVGSTYANNTPRIYRVADERGRRHEAYRLVLAAGGPGEYYGVQGTTWRSPPILANPDRVIREAGRRLLLFYDGRRLRLVGWRTPRGVYWVSNTLSESIPATRLIAIAASLRRRR